MLRPNWRKGLYKYKAFAAGSVVFFCLLLGYGLSSDVIEKVEQATGSTTLPNVVASNIKKDGQRAEIKANQNDVKQENSIQTSKRGELSGINRAPRLILSVRDAQGALPLSDPFQPKILTDEMDVNNAIKRNVGATVLPLREHRQLDRSTERGQILESGAGNAVRTGQLKDEAEPKVIGVIIGNTPLALVEQSGNVQSYAVGEGPSGYQIMDISMERVIWERGIAWEQ